MTQTSTINLDNLKERFIKPFEATSSLFAENEKVAVAQTAVENLQLPNTKMEAWKYTRLMPIFDRSFQTTTNNQSKHLDICCMSDSDAHTFVFVNGIFHSECRNFDIDKQLIVKTFQQLSETEMLIAEKYFASIVPADKDIFTALNTAYNENGLFVYVPANYQATKAIHIQHLTDNEQDIAFQYRNIIVVGENAGVKIVETYHAASGSESLRNAVSEVFVAREGNLEYVKFLNEGNAASHIENITITQGEQSQTAIYTTTLSGRIVRNNLTIRMVGHHASAILNGISLLSNNQHVDNHTEVHHEEPHCTSSELYKGIIGDSATSVFNGKIQVYRDAQKTAAYQSNRNILLTDTAYIYTKPQLEIYADDVKCSHGATTGQMNEEALFYLRARGIKEEDARKLLINAFLQDVIEGISMEFVKNYIEKQLNDKLTNA